MLANIKLLLTSLTPVMLLAFLRNVAAKMTGNVNFPTPPLTPAALTALGDDLEAAIEAATDGSKQSRLVRDGLVEDVRGALRGTADYVRMQAKRDKIVLASSGFPLTNVPAPLGPLTVPVIRNARTTGITGQVEVIWKGQKGADFFSLFFSDVDPALPTTKWVLVASTKNVRYMMNDLEPFKAVWFAVSATGAAGETAKSDPAMGRAAA